MATATTHKQHAGFEMLAERDCPHCEHTYTCKTCSKVFDKQFKLDWHYSQTMGPDCQPLRVPQITRL